MFNHRFHKSAAVRTIEPALRSSFTDDEIALMARLGTVTHFGSGDVLMTEGSDGDHAFFLAAGTATVTRSDEVVAKLRTGDMVGERALLTGDPRNATVTARMPVTALSFDRKQFGWLQLESAKVRSLSRELATTRS